MIHETVFSPVQKAVGAPDSSSGHASTKNLPLFQQQLMLKDWNSLLHGSFIYSSWFYKTFQLEHALLSHIQVNQFKHYHKSIKSSEMKVRLWVSIPPDVQFKQFALLRGLANAMLKVLSNMIPSCQQMFQSGIWTVCVAWGLGHQTDTKIADSSSLVTAAGQPACYQRVSSCFQPVG